MMKPNTNIVKKFAFLSFIGMLLIGLVLGYTISEKIEEMMIFRAKDTYANIVQQNIHLFLAPEHFSQPNYSKNKEAFEKYFSVLRTDEIVRIKVWTKDGTIIYSDIEELVGKNFADNHNFKNAISGAVDIKIERELTKDEQVYERQLGGLMEIYVPVRFNDGDVAGVVELYQNLDFIDGEIYDARVRVGAIIFFGLLILYFSLVWIVKGASNTIVQQSIEGEKSNEALRSSEQKFRMLIEAAPDPMLLINRDARIILINSQVEKMFGYTRDELLGKHHDILLPLSFRDIHEKNIKNYFSNHVPRPMGSGLELFGLQKDGRKIPVEISLSPIETGEGIVVISAIRDITERKKAEETRLENERLVAADKAKSEFLANMSHELRTPLNSILGFSEILKGGLAGKLDEKQEHFIDNIFTSGTFLLSLINDILDLSKIEAGKIELVPEKMSVPVTIKETLSLIKEKASKHNVLLKTEFDPELEFIEADKQRFKQILFNLLSNALKFSKEEGGTVTITAKKEGDMAKISVSDTGIGIREENVGKLFQKFEQLESGISQKYGGTGLGLAITKQLIEMHGGNIRAESKFGEGSTFIFVLPLSANKPVEK